MYSQWCLIPALSWVQTPPKAAYNTAQKRRLFLFVQMYSTDSPHPTVEKKRRPKADIKRANNMQCDGSLHFAPNGRVDFPIEATPNGFDCTVHSLDWSVVLGGALLV